MATSLLTRLALWCYCLQGITISMRSNWCMHSDGSMSCCTSYFEEDGDCYECVGSHGKNCSNPCPENYFGPRCTRQCKCLESECDKIYGCPKETTFPILETSTAKVLGTSHSSQLLEASSNAASKLETFFENLKLRHWLIICSVVFLVVFVFFVIIGTVRRRNKSLLNSSSILKTTTISQKDNKCLQNDGTRQCCSSFYEENNACHECIGSYGVNCSHPCKPGFFGPKCAFKCNCLNNTCDRIHGCFEDVTEGPVKDLDFFGHLKFHWMVFLVIFIFTFILLVCGIVTLKGRCIKRKQKRQLTQRNNYTQ